jgi:hypothetical protein
MTMIRTFRIAALAVALCLVSALGWAADTTSTAAPGPNVIAAGKHSAATVVAPGAQTDWASLGVALPRHGAYSTLQPLTGVALDGVVRYLATAHYDPQDPTWRAIDPSYDPSTAHGFTPLIAQYLNGYKAGTDLRAMRSPEWQALVRARRDAR